MRPASVLAVLLLASLAGCSAFGVTGSGPEPTRTLTPAAVPTAEPTPTPATSPRTTEPAPVIVENDRARDYLVTLSVVDGPVSAVEVTYADGRSVVVDHAADPSALDRRLAEGSVVNVRVPQRAGTARYRVAANGSRTSRPFPALGRAGAGTNVLWVLVPVGVPGVPANVAAAGVEACAPPHSLVTDFRVRVRIGTDRVRVDCA